jgi:uncharacterized protein (TIGR04255 family)
VIGVTAASVDTSEIHLKQDGIRDAVFEIRFETPLQVEVVLGRLADAPAWRGRLQRLPFADIPPQIRQSEPSLRFQPLFEVTPEKGGVVRFSAHSLSCHEAPPYPGWTEFQPRISEALETLYSQVPELQTTRLGLRYINGLNAAEHFVSKPSDLLLTIKAGSTEVVDAFALNYKRARPPSLFCQVSVASPDYVTAPPNESFALLVDVDVFSPEGHSVRSAEDAMAWVETAHTYLKDEFFALWPPELLERLKR